MKMGEMPNFGAESGSDGKDFKKFEATKTRAQKEAEKSAKQMEGGGDADNPTGSSSGNDDYLAFLDQLTGSGSSSVAPDSYDLADIDDIVLPGEDVAEEVLESKKEQEVLDEINRLKQEIEERARAMGAGEEEKQRIAHSTIQQYASNVSASQFKDKNILRDILKLEQEEHDEKIEELLNIIPRRGVRVALGIAKMLKDKHLEDDFHRALVQYVLSGLPTPKLKIGSELWKSLNMILYEVQPGTSNPVEKEQGIQQQKVEQLERLLSTMDQFYAGMLSVTGQENIFTIELAKPVGTEEVKFFVAVPRSKKELFEKHIKSVYPDAKLFEQKNDYNIFVYGGEHSALYAELKNNFTAPLKTYKEFSHDPMNVILNAFSSLDKFEEGAALQFVIGDDGLTHNDFAQKVVTWMRKNKPFKKAVKYVQNPMQQSKDELKNILKESIFGPDNSKPDPIDEVFLENVVLKSKSRIVPVNLRVVASASNKNQANAILDAVSSTFNQFENPRINKLEFKTLSKKEELDDFLEEFIFRKFNKKRAINLSLMELSTMLHLTAAGINASRELKKSRFKQLPAPIEVSNAYADLERGAEKGIILGKNQFGAKETKVPFLQEDRMRHYYVIGQTGTGKTYLLKSMIIQDIKNGEGVCYIDPHGTDIVDILAAVPPERADDLIYFDPAYTARPYGLNILEWDPRYPEQKTFVTNELFEIFVKLFGDVPESLGPMFQQYYRNATLLALEGQEPGKATMADIPKVFADREFRHMLLENSKNPIVNQFWIDIAEKAGGDASLENVTPYITAKTDTFLANEIMRPIIAQEKSTINFREIMDTRKILLVNLSKGRIGELNAQLLGLLIVGKFLQAALSRVEELDLSKLAPFYLYIDEFQNFTTPSISTILSEARKYKLSLTLAHQFIKQLDEKIRDSVFGNVGTKCAFRVSPEDAEFLEKIYMPNITAKDISGIENYNAYLSLLIKGKPVDPFNMETITYDWNLDFEYAEKLRQLSYLKYGRDREEIEKEIAEKYMPKQKPQENTGPALPWL